MTRTLAVIALAGCSKILGISDVTHVDATTPPIGDECGFTQLSAGREFTCGLASDATVWCWGRNGEGQVAPGGAAVVIDATQVSLPARALDVHAGRNTGCARLEDGSAWCWGENTYGGLGDGTTTGHGPTQVALGGEKVAELAIGAHHTCIRRESDSAIMCWGSNDYLELGNTGAIIQPTPQLVVGTTGSAHVVLGHRDACVLDSQGHPQCWGRNGAGELGTTGPNRAAPMPITGVDTVLDLAATGRDTCVIDLNHDLRCWGRNQSGQLGTGDYVSHALPTGVTLADVASAQLMPDAAMSVGTDGVLTGWGSLALDGSLGVRPSPTRTSLANVTGLSAGYYHYCALVDSVPTCWGSSNSAGELGRGQRSFSTTPTPIALAGTVDALTVSYFADVCVRVAGTLRCWGANSFGEIGDGTLFARATPTEITTGLSTIDGVSSVWFHTCAWGGGALRCWGDNNSGQLGDASPKPRGSGPVTAAVTGVIKAATGQLSTCAAVSTGVKCWGNGNAGRLGNGGVASSLTPVDVMGISSATDLASGQGHVCAVSSGTVYCWGNNADGELGDGTTQNRTVATAVTLPTTAIQVTLGFNYSCALLSNGRVYCWGANDVGQLGIGDTSNRSQPTAVQLPLAATAVEIFSGPGGACARLATNSVMCWGETTIASAVAPVNVTALDGATKIAISSEGGCATLFGQVSCWGGKLIRADAVTPDWEPKPVTLTCPRGN